MTVRYARLFAGLFCVAAFAGVILAADGEITTITCGSGSSAPAIDVKQNPPDGGEAILPHGIDQTEI